jgi:hypothetical protein
LKLSNLFSKSIDVGEETIAETKKAVASTASATPTSTASAASADWWYPSRNGKKRIMLCGTYPVGASNGYSKVVYYISKYLGIYEDIELTVYGFQNINYLTKIVSCKATGSELPNRNFRKFRRRENGQQLAHK